MTRKMILPALCLLTGTALLFSGCKADSPAVAEETTILSPPSTKARESSEEAADAPASQKASPDSASTGAAPVEVPAPDLIKVAQANQLSLLAAGEGTVHILSENYVNGELKGSTNAIYDETDDGLVCSSSYTRGDSGQTEYYYRIDGKQYMQLEGGVLMLQASVTDEARARFYQYFDMVESPFLYSLKEEAVSCVLTDGVLELETQLDLSSDPSIQEASGIREGVSHMKMKLDPDTLRILESESYVTTADGSVPYRSRITMNLIAQRTAPPEFMKKFKAPKPSRTITLIFDPGKPDTRTISFVIPRKALFEPVDEDEYDGYLDAEGTHPLREASPKETDNRDLTIYMIHI